MRLVTILFAHKACPYEERKKKQLLNKKKLFYLGFWFLECFRTATQGLDYNSIMPNKLVLVWLGMVVLNLSGYSC